MNRTTIILLGLVMFVFASTRSSNKTKPIWTHHLKGSQKIFGVVAVILTLIIVLNPEFVAPGFLGDTAFFDMMVLALSLQMHMYVVWAFRTGFSVLSRGMRWLGIASPGLRYLVGLSTIAIGSAASAPMRQLSVRVEMRVVRIMLFLGLVVGITACRAPEPVTEVGQRPETPGRKLPHAFFVEHGAEPSFEPTTRRSLSIEAASVLAARLANDQCERQYRRRPFKPGLYPAILRDGAYHWGNLDIGGHAGFSAFVTFFPDGSEPHVEVYFSSDTVLGMR